MADAETTLGFRPRLTLHGPLDTAFPDAVGPHLVAVLVEALSNTARHAEARNVDVRVAVEGSGAAATVAATVSDDGKGFSGTGRESGLRNLRDRAASVGGTFDVESAEGTDTVVRRRAPLDGAVA